MKRLLLFTLMLAMFAPSLVRAAAAYAKQAGEPVVQYHDHSPHHAHNGSNSDLDLFFDNFSTDVYLVVTDSTSVAVPDRDIEKIDFITTDMVLSLYDPAVSTQTRAPPEWRSIALAKSQPPLLLITQRFLI